MSKFSHRDEKTRTLGQLIAETYASDETAFYGFADRGNGCGFGEPGRSLRYDDDAAQAYGAIELVPCEPIKADDGGVEFVYASAWQDRGNGYQFRILF